MRERFKEIWKKLGRGENIPGKHNEMRTIGKYQKVKESKDDTYMCIVHDICRVRQIQEILDPDPLDSSHLYEMAEEKKERKKRHISESHYNNILFYKIEKICICINK